MNKIIYILCALANVPFMLDGSVISSIAFGFCVGVLVCEIMNDVVGS